MTRSYSGCSPHVGDILKSSVYRTTMSINCSATTTTSKSYLRVWPAGPEKGVKRFGASGRPWTTSVRIAELFQLDQPVLKSLKFIGEVWTPSFEYPYCRGLSNKSNKLIEVYYTTVGTIRVGIAATPVILCCNFYMKLYQGFNCIHFCLPSLQFPTRPGLPLTWIVLYKSRK